MNSSLPWENMAIWLASKLAVPSQNGTAWKGPESEGVHPLYREKEAAVTAYLEEARAAVSGEQPIKIPPRALIPTPKVWPQQPCNVFNYRKKKSEDAWEEGRCIDIEFSCRSFLGQKTLPEGKWQYTVLVQRNGKEPLRLYVGDEHIQAFSEE